MVLAEMFREYKQKKQAQEVKESAARVHAQWESWNNKRLEAEKNNLPFNEPPPSLKDSENGSASS